MSRDLTTAVAAALQQNVVPLALFYEGEFASGTVRIWTGLGSIVWNGETWTGLGTLIGMEAVRETSSVEASGSAVSLSGVDPALVSTAIQDSQQGAKGRVWLAALSIDDATGQVSIIADPFKFFVGRLDVPTIQDGADTCTITITYESLLIDLQRPRRFNYTDESQQILFPGDKGFEYVAGIQDLQITIGT